MAQNFLTNIDLNQNELLNAVAHHVAVDPSDNNVEGRIIYNTTDKKFKYWNGTTWESLSSVSIPDVIGVANGGTGVQTLAKGEVVVGNDTEAVTTLAIDQDVVADSTNLITSGGVKRYADSAIDSAIATIEVMNFKGTVAGNGLITSDDETLNGQNLFTLAGVKKGWTLIATEAITTATSGLDAAVEAGDMIVVVKDAETFATDTIKVVQANIDGAVTGPSASTNDNLAVFDGNTGNVIKDSGISKTDISGAITDISALKTHSHTVKVSEGLTGGGTFAAGEEVTIGLGTSGVTAGTYCANAVGTVTAGAEFTIPEIVVDSYGRVTTVTEKKLTMDAFGKGSVNKYTGTNDTLTPVEGVCTWVVNHGLNTTACTVTIMDTNNRVVYADVQFSSETAATITINSTAAIAAGAYKVVITG